MRVPVVALAIVALGGAVAGGLVRLGWPLSVMPSFAAFHGPLITAGSLGTVIGLERAVALGRAWGYGAPIGSGLGALALMIGAPGGASLMLVGSAVLVLVSAESVRRQVALFTATMMLGAVCWLVGQISWFAGEPVHRVAFWWAAFLVLTIAGERLELTRLMRLRASRRATFLVAVGFLVAALVLASVTPLGVTAIGVAVIVLAAWLALFDVARRTVRASGLTRFIAVALLSGYVWLAVAGMLVLGGGEVAAGPLYDAMLHALFVGFVFSMIFGHAPIIVPAVMGVAIAYRPAFYGHLGLLHVSLALRVFGDLASWPPGREWGGPLPRAVRRGPVALHRVQAATPVAAQPPTTAGERIYTCPMHPQIRSQTTLAASPQALWYHKFRMMAGLWVRRANSRPSLIPDVQRMGSAGPQLSAAFSTSRQRLEHPTSSE